MFLTRVALISVLLMSYSYAAEVIVRFKKPIDMKNLPAGFTQAELLVPHLHIYLLKNDQKGMTGIDALKHVSSMASVKSAMLNEAVSNRSVVPNDPSFNEQWGHIKIGAPEAWAYGIGGRNTHRDEVVVAVVDGGADLEHEDLVDNKWVNKAEIPGNGIDDDGNGYIDDINGWNAFNSTGVIPKNEHGTHVAGIMGAKGNNGKHVVGVSWNVKIMAVAASSGDTAIVLKGYGYVYAQKKLWLDSKGREGANVVVTNSSFGVDRADCKSDRYKMWNEIYEEMGKIGILSAVATANQAWDIDKTGDVPSSCQSEYIIAVTNTTKEDKLYSRAGWGKTQIDIAAPGTDIYSTVPGNRARNMTGTSMATPQVAGAVGLLHSSASNTFTVLAKNYPDQAALELKRILLETVDPIEELKDKTVSGGRLNIRSAADVISRYAP